MSKVRGRSRLGASAGLGRDGLEWLQGEAR